MDREVIELLKLLKEQDRIEYGLCTVILTMQDKGIINISEVDLLLKYVKDNSSKERFAAYKGSPKLWYFPYNEKQPRIDWINQQIKKLEEL